MTAPYREGEDRLGLDERESEATRVFGRWRDRLKTTILAAFAIVGLVPAGFGYWLVQQYQLDHVRSGGRISLMLSLGGAMVPWGVALVIGAFVARAVVTRRSPAQVERLASAYEIPAERLAATARLVDRL